MKNRPLSPRTRFYRHKNRCATCGYFHPEWSVEDLCFIGKRLWERWRDFEMARGRWAPTGRVVD
jgi:hypothetical protein